MPNGSGKLVHSIQWGSRTRPDAEAVRKAVSISPAIALQGGIVAARPAEIKEVAGGPWITRSFYFQDINELEIGTNEEERQKFRFARAGDGYRLEWTGALYTMVEHEGQRELLGLMFDEFDSTMFVRLPGDIRSCENCDLYAKNQVRAAFSKQDLLQSNPPSRRIVATGPTSLSPQEIEAFEQELEKAKAEWEAAKAQKGK